MNIEAFVGNEEENPLNKNIMCLKKLGFVQEVTVLKVNYQGRTPGFQGEPNYQGRTHNLHKFKTSH